MKDLVMLAHDEGKHGHKMTYPAYLQPKLDGIRCVAIKEQNNVKLFTRASEEIVSCPHLYYPLQQVMQNGDVLDGELYHNDVGFDRLSGDVRSQDHRNNDYVQYWIYDHPVVLGDKQYNQTERTIQLQQYVDNGKLNVPPLMHVPTFVVSDRDHAMRGLEYYTEQGYEGVMIRSVDATYGFGKRSTDLLKVKKRFDSEFEIIGMEEGKGKLKGHVGKFLCKGEIDGKVVEFKSNGFGTFENRKKMFDEWPKCKGSFVTIEYFELTKQGKPRYGGSIKGIRWDV